MNSDIREAKRNLRKRVIADRDALGATAIAAKSEIITGRFLALDELEGRHTILLYSTFRSEILTHPLIGRLLAEGRRILLPLTDLPNHRLRLFVVKDLADLKVGAYNILEPDPSVMEEVGPEQVDLVVVPGSAFDPGCWRMGYGGGFYDRLLPLLRPGVPRIALAFDLQIVPEVPRGFYDQRLDLIVTESRIIRPG